MLIFLYGQDSCRRIKKKNWYINEFVKKHGHDGISFFDNADEAGYGALESFVRTPSLFFAKKLVVIEEDGAGWERLGPLAKEYQEDQEVHLLISSPASPKGLGFLMKKPATAIPFEPLKGAAWHAWITEEARERGVALTESARTILAGAYANDSWGCATELDRIASFQKGKVTDNDLKMLGVEAGVDAWPLMKDIASYDPRRRLSSLELLLAQGEPAAKLFFIAASFNKDAPRCAAHDMAIKSGKLDYEEALTDLALAGW